MARARVARTQSSQSRRPGVVRSRSSRSGGQKRVGRAFLAFLRFSLPRSASETLVLILTTLGLVSVAAGLYSGIVGGSRAAIYWGAVLLVVAALVRTSDFWHRLGWSPSFDQARAGLGVLLFLVVLVLLTADVVAHALGQSTIPLLGPLSQPWLAYSLMAVVLVAGILILVSGTRLAPILGLPIGLAAQARIPSMTRVTRHTRVDRETGSMVDVAEPGLRDFRSTPLLGDVTKREPDTGPDSEATDGGVVGLVRRSRGKAERPLLPPIDLFNKSGRTSTPAPLDLDAKAQTIERKLASFGVGARVVDRHRGPTVTLFDVEPEPGVKVKRITELQNDLALALAAPTVRIQAPVPGRPVVGIEIPNTTATTVTIREVLESDAFHSISSPLRVAIGKGVGGESVIIDLASMPHLLIAGATGSGKSVTLNVIISSLLFQNGPDDVRLLMIDPKMVELTVYNGVPHLLSPVLTGMDKVLGVLRWTIREMERRYALFRDASVRNLSRYNQLLIQRGEKKLPYIVVIVDELADLMMVAPDEVEDCICRLAQLARATGIHLVIATQRPSVDVVTGLIKANFPARIAFAMSSQVDSRTILDQVGAEKLLGRGDMLYQSPTEPKPVRLQGALVSDHEIEKLVEFWRNVPLHLDQVSTAEFEAQAAEPLEHADALFEQAKVVVREHRRASVSLLQRKLSIGYQRAARLMDMLEKEGVVSAAEGSRYRAVTGVGDGDDMAPSDG